MGCFNTLTVAAKINDVWETMADFHDMSWAEGVISSLETVGDKLGHEVGAKRILNDAFHETLLVVDSAKQFIAYSIDDGPGPVAKDAMTGYRGEIQLHSPDSNNTTIEWRSSWESEQGGVFEMCDPIYIALLSCIEKRFA